MEKNKAYFTKLFLAYIDKTITEKQFKGFQLWLDKSSSNKKLFSNYLLFYNKTRRIGFIKNIDVNKSWEVLLTKVNTPVEINKTEIVTNISSSKKSVLKFLKYAAIFIGIVSLGFFVIESDSVINTDKKELVQVEEEIILEFDNGTTKVIDDKGQENILDKTGNTIVEKKENVLNYKANNTPEKLVYNKLIVPYGKTFQLVLSDGTQVHLNAGTSIKYPIKFIKGENRQVQLLNGEAYFEVTKDKDHPFIVETKEMNVKVLGTSFNISSYPEDTSINTVLVEGAVDLFKKEENIPTHLKPGQLAKWNKISDKISIDEVDTSIYTGWKNGKLIFNNIPFKKIIKKLERRYNVVIINKNESLNNQYFDATFDVETIEQVIKSFNESYHIQFNIENNQIIIN